MGGYEQPRVPRRSASHGTLNSSYSNQSWASAESALQEQTPAFKPLRSIRENATFLDPAASADGMLRKTTETGNIGIFSIHAGRNKALRTRSSLGDLQPHPPLLSRDKERHHRPEDRAKLPPYRDSTSEIISMYGSEKQSSSKSATGTLSPPWDDIGHRSFSMTTCGSQGYSLPRNFGPRHAQELNTQGQRPRSPYPYPTRLPRPGIRPSSPALTENGLVDYSRMVEINRIPQQRTTHHPHPTLFPYKTTRDLPLPLSTRSGVNQSTCSLTDDRGHPRPYPQHISRRPLLPSHLQPLPLRSKHRLESRSSDQSLRTMSLTSTNGGYANSPFVPPRPPQPEKTPIFYDYSENFENVNIELPPDYPVSPQTHRSSSSLHSGMVEDMVASCEGHADGSNGDNQDVVEFLRRASMINDLEVENSLASDDYRTVSQLGQWAGSRSPTYHTGRTGAAMTSSPVSPESLYNRSVSYASIHGVEDRQGMAVSPDAAGTGLVSEDSTRESPFEPETPAYTEPATYEHRNLMAADPHDHGLVNGVDYQAFRPEVSTTVIPRPELASIISTALPYRYSSCGQKDSRFFSGLSDLASFVNYIDNNIDDPDPADVSREELTNPSTIPGSKSAPVAERGQGPDHARAGTTPAPPRKSSLPPHLRQFAASRTYAGDDDLQRYQVVSTRSGPTLVPQPISPAKMLRVKNSIPQLMKALPPLPDFDPAPDPPFGAAVPFEPLELSRLTEARSTLFDASVLRNHEEKENRDHETSSLNHAVSKPKLKLKRSPSVAAASSRNLRCGYLEQTDGAQPESPWASPPGCSTAPVKKRLPLKVSRPTLEPLSSEDTEAGTVKRRHGLGKSSTVSDITSSQPMDLFSTPTCARLQMHQAEGAQQVTKPNEYPHSSPGYGLIRSIPVVTIQQVEPSDEQIGDARGITLDAPIPALYPAAAETCEFPANSFFSDNSAKAQRRGLRKRISDLRSRFGDHHRHHQDSQPAADPDNLNGGSKALVSETEARSGGLSKDLLVGMQQIKDLHRGDASKGTTVRRKLGKLVQGAKHKLRTWGKHKDKRRPG